MHLLSLLCASLFAASLASGKQCVNITVPVSIAARNGIFNIAPLQNNLDATTFAQNLTSGRGNFTQEALLGYATVTGDYTISARFCQPDSGVGSSPVVQFLTHGIGFDKTFVLLLLASHRDWMCSMCKGATRCNKLIFIEQVLGSSIQQLQLQLRRCSCRRVWVLHISN